MTAKQTAKQMVPAIVILGSLASGGAFAYVGPGAGLSLLSALLGVLIAVGAALAFVIFWPIRRLCRNRAAARAELAATSSHVDSPGGGVGASHR